METTVVWRHPRKRHAHSPLVVLLHGRGADERDLLDIAEHLPARFAYASVRAPVPVEGGGYTWFENRGVARPVAASVRTSVAALRAWLDGPAAGQYSGPCFLFGFSAGMMMAGALVLTDPARYTGAVLLSGALALDAGIPAVPGRLAGKPIFYGRGRFDDMIPAELVTRTGAYLRENSGASLTERTYRIGHALSNRELAEIGRLTPILAFGDTSASVRVGDWFDELA